METARFEENFSAKNEAISLVLSHSLEMLTSLQADFEGDIETDIAAVEIVQTLLVLHILDGAADPMGLAQEYCDFDLVIFNRSATDGPKSQRDIAKAVMQYYPQIIGAADRSPMHAIMATLCKVLDSAVTWAAQV